jgi:hypothetical protein
MIPFDPRAYEDAVVKPLRRQWSGGELPDDLLSRYAIELTMSDTQVAERLVQVRAHWNRSAQSAGKGAWVKSVYRAFLRADEELRRNGAALDRIEWWRQYDRARAGARQGQIAELAQTLRSSFADLGLVTAGQLEATRGAIAAALAPDDVQRALAAAGVNLATPVELPGSSGLPDTQYRALRTSLVDASVSSIVELLHGPATVFKIIESFHSDPPVPAGLTGDAVAAATGRENKRSGNAPAREALGILTTAARSGVDIRLLTLFHLLDPVRDSHEQGVPPAAMLRLLEQAKLDPGEARLAVFSVRNEIVQQQARGLDRIKELLAEGRLVAAQQALATIAGTEDASAATALVEERSAEVNRLRTAARQALLAESEQDALNLLRQAAGLAADDEDLVAELSRVPPPPVLGLTATAEGTGVRLAWRAAPSHGEGIRYRLVRQKGRAPADPTDGAVVADGVGATVAVDAVVPAGQPIGYAVFTAAEGGRWSRPATVTTEVLPPVQDVRLSTEDGGGVAGRWQVPPEAIAVEVRRGGVDGVVVPTNSRAGFRDPTPPSGGEHTYTIVVRYCRPDGTEATSAPVIARTAGSWRLVPVSMLRLKPRSGEGGARIEITWRQPSFGEVTVRRARRPSPWPFGEVVPPGEVAGYGEEVVGRFTDQGEWRTLIAAAPSRLYHYVPFTIGEAGAVCGQEASLGVALPVTGLAYQRLDDDVVLSWKWPESTGTAEVTWTGGMGSGRRRLTRQQYQSGGGCQIECGPGEVSVRVHTVVNAEGGAFRSPDAEITVPGRRPTVTYAVQMTRWPVVGGGTVRVWFTVETALPECTVLLVAQHGPVMPCGPTDGQVVLRTARRFEPSVATELVAQLPRLRKPYWVRCFIEGSTALLVDPPVTQLKVS